MEPPVPSPLRVIAGVRATGRMHLGNYFGAARPLFEAAARPEVQAWFCVADVHTLSTERDPRALRQHVDALVLEHLAAGLDPERVRLYTQSSVGALSELAWLFAWAVPLGELERVPAFKQRREGEPPSAALLNYPLLMAADILGPRAHRASVGEDQYPHLELARDVARRLNRRVFAAPVLPEPEPLSAVPVRLASLTGPGKMGKSEHSSLPLLATAEQRWAQLAPAPTDPARRTRSDPGTPERCNVYALHRHASPPALCDEVARGCRDASLGCLECKRMLDGSLEALVAPMRARHQELSAKPGLARELLAAGAVRARGPIEETRDALQEALGLRETPTEAPRPPEG